MYDPPTPVDYDEEVTGEEEVLPNTLVVDVNVVGPVRVVPRPPQSFVTSTHALDPNVAQRVLGYMPTRTRVMVRAIGGDAYIAPTESLGAGNVASAFLIRSTDSPFQIHAADEVWALGAAAGVTLNFYAEFVNGL